ncbi:hypothetical protein AB0M43_15245 [Longispora sp. NPDC051575]|uniref:hypothetical protein n=1 Tax=Longispora sp. NPDC051575 TaxID=3154943 RepID=UPI003436BE14
MRPEDRERPGSVESFAANPSAMETGAAGVDLSSSTYDDQLAQLGQWAKEGWHWEDIESRVYDLFDIPQQHRPAE